MHLRSLSLVNFKNYEQAEISLSPRINCFVGENGVGKTNVLDAVHYLALCKSNLNPVDTQNIRYGEEMSLIQGVFERREKDENILCGLNRQKKKQFKRNKKDYTRLSDHIGLLPVVMISPSDGSLITEGGEERRRFINAVIAQYDHEYLESLLRYNRALTQRNTLLKSFNRDGSYQSDQLEVWNDQLFQYGSYIFKQRESFIQELIPIFQRYYDTISGGKEKTGLSYRSQLHETGFPELFRLNAEKDRILQHTTAGVHKDDLLMTLDALPMKRIGSQGQQKTFLVALKMAKFEFIKKINGFHPILLLDDVFDKFDAGRVRQIIRLVAEHSFGQIFITDTNTKRISDILVELDTDHKLFIVAENQVVQQKENGKK